MEIHTQIENGKAYLEFGVSFAAGDAAAVIRVWEQGGREVFRCIYPAGEEEPARGMLLHPHLWNSVEDPYLYKVTVHFVDSHGGISGSQEVPLALYTMEEIPGKGYFLNGKPFQVQGIRWDMSINTPCILDWLREMGANTLYLPENTLPGKLEEKSSERLSGENTSEELWRLCMEMGFLVQRGLPLRKENEESPSCSELFAEHVFPLTDTYYHYKALWSKEPFVYICMSSIRKQENGHLSLSVYSNQKKIVLYVEGVVFEFRTGGQEYLFEEIPVKKYPVVLTAEAGECSGTVTVYEISQNV